MISRTFLPKSRAGIMRITLAASVLMLALAAPAQAANKQSWDFVKSGNDEAQIAYGVPESDSITIVFRCFMKTKRIEIISTVLPRKAKKDQPLRTTLTNGGRAVAYDGKIGRSTEEFHFETSVAAEPKAVAILKPGALLTIGIPGKQVRVPLRGVAKPLAQFETACLGKR
jgi:hypothetical protein